MICYDLDNINYPVTIAFPTGLAKETKQDDQIVIADAIKTQTDKLTFANGNLNVNASISEKLLQVDSVGNTTYLGYASAGSLTSAPLWAIKKIVEVSNDVAITWADGNTNFDNIWDNRLSLTYA
jgi:hypothetical protein